MACESCGCDCTEEDVELTTEERLTQRREFLKKLEWANSPSATFVERVDKRMWLATQNAMAAIEKRFDDAE